MWNEITLIQEHISFHIPHSTFHKSLQTEESVEEDAGSLCLVFHIAHFALAGAVDEDIAIRANLTLTGAVDEDVAIRTNLAHTTSFLKDITI